MTNFEKFKSLSLSDLSRFLDENQDFDTSVWTKWFSETFCDKCKTIIGTDPYGTEHEYAPCEVNQCPYGVANMQSEEVINLWFSQEYTGSFVSNKETTPDA